MEKLDLARRGFLQSIAGLCASPFAAANSGQTGGTVQVLPGLHVIRGSVNTGLLERNGRKLLIDSAELQAAPGGGVADWALFTHHHRDQGSEAWRLQKQGTRIGAPAAEKDLFEDAQGFWQSSDLPLDGRLQKMRPALFTLRDSAPVARAFRNGAALDWEGLRIEAIDTPGHTDGSVTYLVQIGGKRVAFTGDLIYAPGQIWEMFSLQKRYPGMVGDYWGFGGAAEQVKSSLARVLERKPDLLIPSHGFVMTEPAAAVAALHRNLDAVMDNFLTTAAWRIYTYAGLDKIRPRDQAPRMLPALPQVSYPKWIRHVSPVYGDTSAAIIAADGHVFLSDCASPETLKELERLQGAGEIRGVDGIWITHYHSDHNAFVNAARNRFGAKVYVQRELADITANPTAYNMPALNPEPIPVDRILEDGESFEWRGFKLTAYHFPGQTLYHGGLLAEKDGFKAFFTGDSFANWGVDDYCSENRCFIGEGVGYDKCLRLLLRVKPDILVAAHWRAQPITTEYVRKTLALFEERRKLYTKLLPHSNPNFGLDPYWIRAYPYRQAARPGAEVGVEARVLNHGAAALRIRVELRLPAGWEPVRPSAGGTVEPRSEGRFTLVAKAPRGSTLRRHVIGIRAEVDGRSIGEFAEAIAHIQA